MGKILIVEDDEVIADGMARHLAAAGLDPRRRGVGELGLARLRYEKPDACVLDLMLPGLDGWKLIETALGGDRTPIVVASGPAAHDAAFPAGVTSTVGEALIWRTKESASLAHCSGVRMTGLTCMPRRA